MFGWQLPRRLLVRSRVYHSIDRASSPSYPFMRAFIRYRGSNSNYYGPSCTFSSISSGCFRVQQCKFMPYTRKALPSESGSSPSTNEWCLYMSSDHNLGSFLFIGDYTIELYGDYTTELVTLGIYRG